MKGKEIYLREDDIIEASRDKHDAELTVHDFGLSVREVEKASKIVYEPMLGAPIVLKNRAGSKKKV